jgi:hypothetical protein
MLATSSHTACICKFVVCTCTELIAASCLRLLDVSEGCMGAACGGQLCCHGMCAAEAIDVKDTSMHDVCIAPLVHVTCI